MLLVSLAIFTACSGTAPATPPGEDKTTQPISPETNQPNEKTLTPPAVRGNQEKIDQPPPTTGNTNPKKDEKPLVPQGKKPAPLQDKTFTLSSTTFTTKGGIITDTYTGTMGVSPPLSWKNAPEGTEYFYIFMQSLQPPPTYHWVAEVAKSATGVSEGEYTSKTDPQYIGPARNNGRTYEITVYATSSQVQRINVKPKKTKQLLENNHLAKASISGTK